MQITIIFLNFKILFSEGDIISKKRWKNSKINGKKIKKNINSIKLIPIFNFQNNFFINKQAEVIIIYQILRIESYNWVL